MVKLRWCLSRSCRLRLSGPPHPQLTSPGSNGFARSGCLGSTRTVHIDDQGVLKVVIGDYELSLKPGNKKTHKAYIWSYCTTTYNPIKAVVFNFTETRSGEKTAASLLSPVSACTIVTLAPATAAPTGRRGGRRA